MRMIQGTKSQSRKKKIPEGTENNTKDITNITMISKQTRRKMMIVKETATSVGTETIMESTNKKIRIIIKADEEEEVNNTILKEMTIRTLEEEKTISEILSMKKEKEGLIEQEVEEEVEADTTETMKDAVASTDHQEIWTERTTTHQRTIEKTTTQMIKEINIRANNTEEDTEKTDTSKLQDTMMTLMSTDHPVAASNKEGTKERCKGRGTITTKITATLPEADTSKTTTTMIARKIMEDLVAICIMMDKRIMHIISKQTKEKIVKMTVNSEAGVVSEELEANSEDEVTLEVEENSEVEENLEVEANSEVEANLEAEGNLEAEEESREMSKKDFPQAQDTMIDHQMISNNVLEAECAVVHQ